MNISLADLPAPPHGREVLRFRVDDAGDKLRRIWDVSEAYSVTVGIAGDGETPEECDLIVWGWIRGEWHANANARPVVWYLLGRAGITEE